MQIYQGGILSLLIFDTEVLLYETTCFNVVTKDYAYRTTIVIIC